mgnify:CR=1 FL=1
MRGEFSSLDVIIVLSFLVGAIFVGIFTGSKIKSFKDYISFYKNGNPAFLGLSLAMVIFGSGTLIGAISEMYQVGIIYLLASAGYIFNSLITARYIIPKIDDRFTGMITVADMIKHFYGKQAERFSAVIAVLFDVGALTTQLMVIGKLLSYFFQIDYNYCLVFTGAIMITYSSLGGIRVITIMDLVKCLMLLIFIPILASISVYKAGGMIHILQNIPSKYLSIFDHKDFIKYGVLFIFFMLPIHMVQPIVIQRILLINDTNTSSKAMYIYALVRFILLWVTAAIALAIIFNNLQINAQDVLYTAIFKIASSGSLGLIVTSLLAVVICKADAHLNSSGIILTKNIIPSNDKDHKVSTLNKVRGSTIAIGLLGIIIAYLDFSIIKIIVFIETLWGISIGIPLLVSIMGIKQKQQQFWCYITFILPIFIGFYIYNNSYSTSFIVSVTGAYIFLIIHTYFNQKNHMLKWHFFIKSFLQNAIKNICSYRHSFSKLSDFSTKHVERGGADYFTFSIFFGLNYTIPVFMWGSAKEYLIISVILRGIAIILCFILLMKSFWPTRTRRYFPLFWHFVLTYTLSFIPLSGLFLNNWSSSGLIDVVLSILLLIVLTDWLVFVIIISLGALLSIGFCKIVLHSISFPTDISTGYLAIYSFIFSILIGIVFARRKEEAYDEKLDIVTAFGGVIAHEMRTFLLSIKNYIVGTKRHFNVLLESYEVASKEGLITDTLTVAQQEILKRSNLGVSNIIRRAFLFIDNLLVNIKGPTENIESTKHNILDVINEAVKSFPLSVSDRKIIRIKAFPKNNFLFQGNKEIVIHILYNLMSNALHFVAKEQKPEIKLIIEKNNILIVEDNGIGIAKNDLNKVFDKFFSKGKKGTGLGLSFCKAGMRFLGGEIKCFSVPGKYTKFVMNFPKIL